MCAGIGIAAAVASVMAVRRLPWAVGIRFGLCTACGTSVYEAASVIYMQRRLAINLRLHFTQSTLILGVICFTIGHSFFTYAVDSELAFTVTART